MDTFFEQLVAIKKNTKSILSILAIWVAALILCIALFLFNILGSLSLLAIFGVIFGAYKLSVKFNIEYEYIITNGIMDIDKIINKSVRKRIFSFNLSSVTRLEKYNQNIVSSNQKVEITCNINDDDAYLMVLKTENGKAEYLVFSPNDRLKEAIIKFVPKHISNNVFK